MLNVIHQHPNTDAIFFLGDGERDADDVEAFCPEVPLYRVQGNCDFASPYPIEGLAPLGGMLFFYTHGHQYHVKTGTDELAAVAKRTGADAALYGHTHTPLHEVIEGVHVFNPGSLNLPREGGPTYGLITLQGNKADFQILPYEE